MRAIYALALIISAAALYVGCSGADGADGAPGKDGVNGEAGLPGTNGTNGKDGVNGEAGPSGKDGVNGEAGPQGPAGEAGPPGPMPDGAVTTSCLQPCHGFSGIAAQYHLSGHSKEADLAVENGETEAWTPS